VRECGQNGGKHAVTGSEKWGPVKRTKRSENESRSPKEKGMTKGRSDKTNSYLQGKKNGERVPVRRRKSVVEAEPRDSYQWVWGKTARSPISNTAR